MRPARQAGFTLVEVMVALAITAIALTTGIKATTALTQNAGRQGQLLLAQICAQNRLVELRLARRLPGVGDSSSSCTQGDQRLQLQQQVRATPNPNFQRVEVAVGQEGYTITQVSTILGRE